MRGGLLRHGSILTVTSYATRTSPVLRGKWVLDNLLGVPPPAPPPDVPALKDNTVDGRLSGRMRLAEHRQNKAARAATTSSIPWACRSRRSTPSAGDATSRTASPIDASGGLPDGRTFTDVTGLEAALLARPELLASTITEKLLTYACGRGVEPSDAPAVRAIVRARAAAGVPHVVDRARRGAKRALPDEDVTMIITKKAVPRRALLRGMGASVALPLLDAMLPAMTALAKTPARPVRRLGFVYMPMGCDLPRWTPPGEGRITALSPTLQSLAPVANQLTILSNLELKNAYPGTHATSNAAFLSAARAKWTESTDYYLGTTIDQVAAQQMGRETLLPSLEMSMDLLQTVGPVRQRVRVRVPEQPVVGLPHHAAAGRGTPAPRVRAAVRRRRQRGGSPGGAAAARQPPRRAPRGHRAPAADTRRRGSRARRRVPRHRA